MSINIDLERLLALSDARTAFPGDKRLSLATLHRWRIKGVRGVRLETVLVGGLRYTSQEAITRFIAAQNAEATPEAAISLEQRQRQAEAAQVALAKAGV